MRERNFVVVNQEVKYTSCKIVMLFLVDYYQLVYNRGRLYRRTIYDKSISFACVLLPISAYHYDKNYYYSTTLLRCVILLCYYFN